ncbi:class II aldolase/adducin family protein [Christensenella intestinihominis]|uniref:class II aldolase/adducin family protein n=1 Tax=Christensenella intestinihominis TaxID=1851429 RepID=UPI00082E0B97|nr:class II aldolase/adducin family protein [Christensenella intestinihominis]
MAELSYMDRRMEMLEIIRFLYDRKLTNAAGGNLSERVAENRVLITPTMMSEHHRCRLKPEDLMIIDYDCNIIEGPDMLSRESRMHTMLLKNFPEFGAVIHAHPQFSMCFAAFSQPIPSVTEATMKMGDCGVIHQAWAYSEELAIRTNEYFMKNRERAQKMGLEGILPQHGIVAAAPTLNKAYSIVERVEYDAMANIFKPAVYAAQENLHE